MLTPDHFVSRTPSSLRSFNVGFSRCLDHPIRLLWLTLGALGVLTLFKNKARKDRMLER